MAAEPVPAADTVRMSEGPWFTRYEIIGVMTTLWEFSIDGLSEDEALEVDRRIKEIVTEVEGRHSDGSACGTGDG